ncbi:MAG: ribonuclease HII [Cyanobacteria bacterium P01_A01_bin.135]
MDQLKDRGAKPPLIIAGVDEVGRGALFGPVVAAAVILSAPTQLALAQAGVTDSKALTVERRAALYGQICAMGTCAIGLASAAEIDQINILQASLLAMRRAVARLTLQPTYCLVDGNQQIPGLNLPQKTMVKGDRRSLVIAAASIVAKVWRDRLIVRLAAKYPDYDLASNKGYGTPRHKAGLKTNGLTRYHRLSFSTCRAALSSRANAERQGRLF